VSGGLAPVRLAAATPDAWFELAATRVDDLLLDHANCEKKAASTALSLMFAYPERDGLVEQLSRLAREELRHFEQVQRLLRERRVGQRRLSPSRYATGLRRRLRHDEPARLVDLLLCGALIEARSCERFLGLRQRLEPALGEFYGRLAASEARHATLYIRLAEQAGGTDLARRLASLAAVEAELATTPDPEFRFHSGTPV